MTTEQWHYFRAGQVERGANYAWHDGYSRVTRLGIEYPWLTKREAQSAAKQGGAQAVFHDNESEARKRLPDD